MSRNKLLIALLIALMLPKAALADDLIDEQLLVPESANYDTLTIEYGDYTKSVTAAGYQVFPVEQDLAMEEGTARLAKVHVIRNAEVHAGDVLVTYEKEGSRAELERMELALQRTEEGFEAGKLQRTEALRKLREQLSGLTDSFDVRAKQLEIQKAQVEYDMYVYQTEYSMRQQRADIEELSAFFADTQIVAPFDGVITGVTTKNPGDTVYAGEVLVTVQAQDRYVIGLDNASGNFRYGMRVSVGLGPRNKKTYVDGRIIAAANILPSEISMSYALVELYGEATESGLKNISIEGKSIELGHVLKISRKAITFDGGKSYVSILDGDMVQKRIIVSGHNAAGDTWVVQGLSEGQQVIID